VAFFVSSNYIFPNFATHKQLRIPRRERNKFVKKNQVLELRIEDYAFGGKGIARIKSEEGSFVIFVPNTLPSQLVKAQINKSSKNYAEAKLIDVIKPSEVPFSRYSWSALHSITYSFTASI
jgi:predicted RNA-binding protein with TRAM domain